MKEKLKKILLAITLIVLGIIVGLNSLEITSINIFFDGWWTLIIIIPSLIGVIDDKDTGSLVMLLVGILLLLNARGIFVLNVLWKLIIPIILVFMGINVLRNDVFSKSAKKLENVNKKAVYTASFSTKNNVVKEDIEALSVEAIFGENTIDLRNIEIKEDIYIKALAMFGEVKIITPKGQSIKLNANKFFGSVQNNNKNIVDENKKIININASAIFGEVDII